MVTVTTGAPYGDYTNPQVFGSGGGLGSSAGSGGGLLSLQIADTLVVEGTLTLYSACIACEQAFGRAGNFPFPFLTIFSPNREPVHRLCL